MPSEKDRRNLHEKHEGFLLVHQVRILGILDIGRLPPVLRGKLMFFVHGWIRRKLDFPRRQRAWGAGGNSAEVKAARDASVRRPRLTPAPIARLVYVSTQDKKKYSLSKEIGEWYSHQHLRGCPTGIHSKSNPVQKQRSTGGCVRLAPETSAIGSGIAIW
jgi:hypothetical protein